PACPLPAKAAGKPASRRVPTATALFSIYPPPHPTSAATQSSPSPERHYRSRASAAAGSPPCAPPRSLSADDGSARNAHGPNSQETSRSTAARSYAHPARPEQPPVPCSPAGLPDTPRPSSPLTATCSGCATGLRHRCAGSASPESRASPASAAAHKGARSSSESAESPRPHFSTRPRDRPCAQSPCSLKPCGCCGASPAAAPRVSYAASCGEQPGGASSYAPCCDGPFLISLYWSWSDGAWPQPKRRESRPARKP